MTEQTQEKQFDALYEAEESRLKDNGWDGEECRLCFVRRKAIEAGTWNVRFRWCPHCAVAWR